jgi:hypothetical protein
VEPARSALTGSEFISEKLRRDTIVLIFHRSASQAQKPCKVCTGWLKVQNLPTQEKVEDYCREGFAQSQKNSNT